MGFFTFLYQASGLQVSILHRRSPRPPAAAASCPSGSDTYLRPLCITQRTLLGHSSDRASPGATFDPRRPRAHSDLGHILCCLPICLFVDTGRRGYMRHVELYAPIVK